MQKLLFLIVIFNDIFIYEVRTSLSLNPFPILGDLSYWQGKEGDLNQRFIKFFVGLLGQEKKNRSQKEK